MVVGAVAVALALLPAVPASAAGTNWWFDWYDVGSAHAAGADGDGVRIAVIDSQINPSLPVFQGADLTVHEPAACGGPSATTIASEGSVHGSDVTALLVGNGTGTTGTTGIVPRARVTFYGLGVDDAVCRATVGGVAYSTIGLGIRAALRDGNRVISISQAQSSPTDGDVRVIAEALADGVVIVAANGNSTDAATAREDFPEASNGVVTVNAFADDGALQRDAAGAVVAWKDTTIIAAGVHFPSLAASSDPWTWGAGEGYGSGASLATPLTAGMIALTMERYPSATGDQVVQSLIRNTTADEHPLARDENGQGYGPVSLTHLLRVDPTRYRDANPLMQKTGGSGRPTAAEVAAASRHTVTGQPATGTPTQRAPGVPAVVTTVLIGIGVLLGIVAVIVVLAVLIGRRRREGRGTA